MRKTIELKLNRFDGGIENDARDTAENTCRMVSNFDIISNPHKLTPYYDSEDGDENAATLRKQNFAIALRTGTTYNLFALGVQSAQPTRAQIAMKTLTTGGTKDLGDNTWNEAINNNQAASGATSFDLFVYYKKVGRIFGASGGDTIWSFDPSSAAAFSDASHALSYTNIAQGLVHSKDDILYIPYDNVIAKNNNGSWTDAALTLPSYLKINSICEFGNYLAIGCVPLSGVGNSIVYLWDRDSSLTTLSESIDFGSGLLKVLEVIDGYLIGISIDGGVSQKQKDEIIFRYSTGGVAKQFKKIVGTTSSLLPIAKQKINSRLFFMLFGTFAGTRRSGVFSIGLSGNKFVLSHERSLGNTAAASTDQPLNFIYIGDFLFQSYVTSSTYTLSKTNDSVSYTNNAIYESKKFDIGDSFLTKKLIGVSVMTEYMPTDGQIVLNYKKDEDTSWTLLFTHTTDNSLGHGTVNIESSGVTLPDFKEIQFQIISTGGAEITGLKFKCEFIDKQLY